MMQTTDLRDLDYRTAIDRVHFPALRAIHLQRLVHVPFVVVAEVRSEDPKEVFLIEDNHVIEALSPNGADESFHGFCQGLRAALRTSSKPMAVTRDWKD